MWLQTELTYDSLFILNQRGLAVGEVCEPTLEELIPDGRLKRYRPEPYGQLARHTVSGFLGCSGGMMCHFKDNDMNVPQVIGICKCTTPMIIWHTNWCPLVKGDIHRLPFNRFVRFTAAGIAWIRSVVKGEATSEVAFSAFEDTEFEMGCQYMSDV